MKETITFKNYYGDIITLDVTDQDIHETMETMIRLLQYMSYADESIIEGLDQVTL